ncbi:hypothetical protein M9Y10_012765 [Tritrichomonas musculus]|uniref:Integral membrane protein n=1 Tax=Tritrichomonas musculus TaxID=1915356 RepID=A0ABR2IDX1_9EUKA
MVKYKSKYLSFAGLAVLSIFGNLIHKAMSTTITLGLPQDSPHFFHKPWFQTLYMFLAEFLSIFVYIFIQCKNHKGKIRFQISFNFFFFLSIPAICDLTMTVLHLTSFLYLGVSISIIIGFSRLIFSALIARIFLHQKIRSYQLFAIFIIFFSFIFVSIAIVKGTGTPPIQSSPTIKFLAVAAKLLAHLIDAVKTSIEQHIMQQMKVDSIFLVAAEGFWGFIATLFIFIPIVSRTSPGSIIGLSENQHDTYAMLSNSKFLRIIVYIDIFFILFLNIFHMVAVRSTSALFETLFQSFQSALVWASQILIYYLFKNTKYDEYKKLGEQWTNWSFLQLIGFFISIAALLIYNGIISIPCLMDFENAYEEIPNENLELIE